MENLELNVNCLKSEKAKRLKELEDRVYGLDCTVDNPLFTEQMEIAKELLSELQKNNPKFIFAIKDGEANEVYFICKLATNTSQDGYFGSSCEYGVLNIDVDGYFEACEFEKLKGVIQ